VETLCPVIRTFCPSGPTCQQYVPTVSPAELTKCPVIPSLCPEGVPCGPADLVPPPDVKVIHPAPVPVTEPDEPATPGDDDTVPVF
jgi:hypothetical protein